MTTRTDPASSGSGTGSPKSVIQRLVLAYRALTGTRARRTALLYIASAGLVALSYLIWYNFNAPPIGSNEVFNLHPWRQVGLSLSLFDPYYWPGSFVPQAYGTPYLIYYGTWFTVSGGSYSFATFFTIASLDCAGGMCLFYLVSKWLSAHRIPRQYALIAVLIYSFNVYKILSGYGTYGGYFSLGPFSAGDPAALIILTFLTYLALSRTWKYALVLGVFSFFVFSYFPNSTLILSEEFIVVLLFLLYLRVVKLRELGQKIAVQDLLWRTARTVGSIIVANAYLIFPLLLTGSTYTGALQSSNPSYVYSFTFDSIEVPYNAIRLISNWWVATPDVPTWVTQYLSDPMSVALTSVLPVVAFASIFYLKNRTDYSLYLMMVLVLLASFGSNPPFGAAFIAVITNVPLLRPFYNAEYFSPILLTLYAFFASLVIGRLACDIRIHSFPRNSIRSDDQGAEPVQRRPPHGLARTTMRIAAGMLVVALIASCYPALTPAYGKGTAEFPSSSALPTYYLAANRFLTATNPNAAVMVFPSVASFTPMEENNTTWFNGPNPFAALLANPSISGYYPSNYEGSLGGELPIPAFIYSGIGATACPIDNCTGDLDLIPQVQNLEQSDWPEFVTSNTSSIKWMSGTPGDNLSLATGPNSTEMDFDLNLSNQPAGDHWALGFFPSPLNLSRYTYAVVTLNLSSLDPNLLEFGFHSGSNYGNGSAFIMGDSVNITEGNQLTVLLPLGFPDIVDGGNLTKVTNLFFVYLTQSGQSGRASLTVSSVRFATLSDLQALGWVPSSQHDSASLRYQNGSTTLDFRLNLSSSTPSVHWLIGSLRSPLNFTDYTYAAINYSTVGIQTQALQFGFHSETGGFGNGYVTQDFLSVQHGGQTTTIIDLTQPTISNNGDPSHVVDFFFNYQPASPRSQIAYLNVSSVELVRGLAGGQLIAEDLARLGAEYAYVDIGVATSSTPSRVGQYYNTVFSDSPDFTRVFSQGTITIYRDLLYSGLLSTSTDIEVAPNSTGVLLGDALPYLAIYDNASNEAVTYVSSRAAFPSDNLGISVVTSYSVISATKYSATVSASAWSLLVFRTTYDSRWVAAIDGGTILRDHVVVDGFGNGWLAPPGNYTVTITLSGQSIYEIVEAGTFLAPAAMGLVLAALWIRRSYRQLSRTA